MNTAPASSGSNAVPDMWHGPARLQPILPMLSHLPRPLGERILAGLAVADGVMRTERLRRAAMGGGKIVRLSYSASHRPAGESRASPPTRRYSAYRTRSAGRQRGYRRVERLQATTGAALLLGFHLGPPLSLGPRLGYHAVSRADWKRQPATTVGRLSRTATSFACRRSRRVNNLGLLQLRRLLGEGARIYMTGDAIRTKPLHRASGDR